MIYVTSNFRSNIPEFLVRGQKTKHGNGLFYSCLRKHKTIRDSRFEIRSAHLEKIETVTVTEEIDKTLIMCQETLHIVLMHINKFSVYICRSNLIMSSLPVKK